jgi:hypothetical protein
MREFLVEFSDGTSTTVDAKVWRVSEVREDGTFEVEFHNPPSAAGVAYDEPVVYPSSRVASVWRIEGVKRTLLWPK